MESKYGERKKMLEKFKEECMKILKIAIDRNTPKYIWRMEASRTSVEFYQIHNDNEQ